LIAVADSIVDLGRTTHLRSEDGDGSCEIVT
jgi:hypothetical protein